MSAKHIQSPCEKRFKERHFHNFIRKFFIVEPLAVQNSLVFRDGSLEVVGNIRFVRIQSIRVVNVLIVDVHFNIGKNWVQNVVYMSNDGNWSVFLRRLLHFCFCLFFVLLFYSFAIVGSVTTTPDKFQFQSQVRLSQINVIIPIRLKLKLYAVFIKWGVGIDFLFLGQQDIVNYWDFPSKTSRNCYKRLIPKITRHDEWKKIVKTSLRDRLICFADFVGMTLLAVLFLLPLLTCFVRVCLPTLFAAVFKFVLPLTTSAKCCAAFCSWDDIFTQKWNCSSPNILCKCTESPSTLSTNTSIEWNLYLSWSNHLVTSFRLEMNVGGFFEHQNKTSDTDRYRGYFFTARVSQANVNIMKKILEQRSELQVAKCLIVHVLPSSYDVSGLEFQNKRKATQQWSLCVINDFVLNQLRVYHEKVYADKVVSKFWFVRSFSSQHHSNSLLTLLPKICPRSVLKNARQDFWSAR